MDNIIAGKQWDNNLNLRIPTANPACVYNLHVDTVLTFHRAYTENGSVRKFEFNLFLTKTNQVFFKFSVLYLVFLLIFLTNITETN